MKDIDQCFRVVDVVNNADAFYYRPSDISYNSDYIGKDTGRSWDGTRLSIFDELREGLYRYKTTDEISHNVVVVRRKIDRRSSATSTGWWAVRGNEELWVLKRLEETGHVKYAKVNHIV